MLCSVSSLPIGVPKSWFLKIFYRDKVVFLFYHLTNPTTVSKIIKVIVEGNTIVNGNTLRKFRGKDGQMSTYETKELPELDKDKLIDILTDELPSLRAKIGLSQEELSGIIGISRQTYSAIETKKRKMSWSTFMSLILLYGYNEKTTNMVEAAGAFPPSLRKILSINKRMEGDA